MAANSGDLLRGTILAKNADGKLEPLGKTEGAKAYGILTDDTADSTEETPVTVYLSGKFNSISPHLRKQRKQEVTAKIGEQQRESLNGAYVRRLMPILF